MACRHSLTKKTILLRRWYHPSLSHIVYHRRESDKEFHSQSHSQSQNGIVPNISGMSRNGRHGFLLRQSKFLFVLPFTQGFGPSLLKYMSTQGWEGSNNVELLGDAANTLTDKTVEVVSSQAPAVSEVALAAAESSIPVAAIQYLIDIVHSFTGLNWWAAIAVTTILVRGATLPFLINQLKATYKFRLIGRRLKEIKQQIQASDDPIALDEGTKKMDALFARYGVSPFTPWKELLVQGPIFIGFYLAIANMVEKVPSLRTGGALWFTDLTTPDTLCIFPLLTSLSFLITAECYVREGSQMTSTKRNSARIIAILTVPLLMGFPKAFFCYWIPSNVFNLAYVLGIKHPEIRKLFDLPAASMSSTGKSPSRQSVTSSEQHETDEEPTKSPDSSQVADTRVSSLAVIKQRIRHLEKQLKAEKKNKKAR
ncbi:mitochondrial inner membrane protein OXA1-like [Silene latifolia]|uniref:mitochondrial inner membrane protein OXA1-like n=1 Tax=Silene latifolia TaxID=37657 RepID=UPI003D77C492